MARISFERLKQTARFHNPLLQNELDEQPIEVRLDPLTGHQSIYNPALDGKKAVLFPETDEAYMQAIAEKTKERCYLCEDRWSRVTPKYTADIIPEGRLIEGEAVLFPNLFPLAAYHAVVKVGDRHYLPLNEFSVAVLQDAFSIVIEFIKRCSEADPDTSFFTINANYLFPAGASVVHPHLQILGSPYPGTHHGMLLNRSLTYYERQGTCYWTDLIAEEERLGQRIIGRSGKSVWFTAFSPIGANEVNAVWPERTNFLAWDDEDIESLADGLSKVLRGYHEMKYSTFNFSCYGGPGNVETPEFRCVLRLVNRQNVMPQYRSDDYYLQKLLNDEIVVNLPENLAHLLRKYF